MQPEPITPLAPRSAGRTVFTQNWCQLAFIHWEVEPERVAPLMPPGVRPDVFDGVTHVGLVPFSMERIGLFGGPAVPYFGTFLETNVRLYGVDEQGRRGVVFCSLEAARLATVVVTRVVTGLNYLWAGMTLHRDGDRIEYSTHRRWPGPRGASSHAVLTLGSAIAPTLFGIALLCCGLNSTVTATLSGQIVMEGFIDIRLPAWARRLITRAIAIVPAAIVTIWYGEKGTAQLLILSQVILSLQLPFAVVPLVCFTSDRRKMGEFVNPPWIKVLAWAAAGLIIMLNLKYLWDFFGVGRYLGGWLG